ncbi:MAG: hypothetical protein GWP09_02690 [Nitrospiraceae bacterium]|nr:hypothetical protein [Nitrospiraceae bacterium]
MFFSLHEILDLFIMSFGIGFIFSDIAKTTRHTTGNLEQYYLGMLKSHSQLENELKDILFATLAIAPGIILHEMGHKFTAIAFGINATFHAAYFWLGIGLILKLINFPFLFFIPGYVSFSPIGLYGWQTALIAFMGPAMNLIVAIASKLLALHIKAFQKSEKWQIGLIISYKVNLFLFFFNLIPFPPFDGYSVLHGLMHPLSVFVS